MIVQRYRIWSIEHDKWWAPYCMGYVSDVNMAGIYSFDEAVVLCKQANKYIVLGDEMRRPMEAMVPIDHDNE